MKPSSPEDLVCGVVPSSAHMQLATKDLVCGLYTEDLVCGMVLFGAHVAGIFRDLVCGIIPSSAHMQPASTKDLVCSINREFGVRHGIVLRICSQHLQYRGNGVRLYRA
jgi:hypothetical protein